MLFSFLGGADWSHTITKLGTGDVKVWTEADDYRFIPKYPGSGEIYLAGIADTRYVPHVIGSGTFRKFAGAAESLTFNPEEKQMLFSFIGTREAEKLSVATIGSGTVYLTGESTQLLTFAEVFSGTIPVSGEANIHYVPNVIGSGTFRKLSGAAESISFNPEERQLLFSFTGELTESVSSVTEGQGSLYNFGGSAETLSFVPAVGAHLKLGGDALITASLLHIGSGTFRKLGGGAESLTVNPDERQLLFSFTGEGSERTSVAEIKQVEIDITGKADPVLRTHAFHGSGTISVFGLSLIHI